MSPAAEAPHPGEGKRIQTVLGEFRMMVPALGALLGFQLVVAFQTSFPDLAPGTRLANFLGVLCTMLTLLFLLMPAAYHRFPHDLDESHAFLRFSQQTIGLAFAFLPLSLAASLYVQAVRTFHSEALAFALAGALLAALVAGWWAVPWARAARRARSR